MGWWEVVAGGVVSVCDENSFLGLSVSTFVVSLTGTKTSALADAGLSPCSSQVEMAAVQPAQVGGRD